MIKLYNKLSGEFLGQITPEQFQFLKDQLEEESVKDTDYYLRRETLDEFERDGADKSLVNLLRQAMGENKDVEIQWSRYEATG